MTINPFLFDDALDSVMTSRGVTASSDEGFRGWLFARDALWVAYGLMPWRPHLTERIILTCASLQGSSYHNLTDEEPGKIMHQSASSRDGAVILPNMTERISNQASQWGLDDAGLKDLTVYFSADSTCLFLITVSEYCRQYGRSCLGRKFLHISGEERTLAESVAAAVGWLKRNLAGANSGKSGLLEFKTKNPKGVRVQALRDSGTAFFHLKDFEPTGLNATSGIAVLDVQVLAYWALLEAHTLFGDRELKAAAVNLQRRILQLLWLPQENRFAMGVDFSPETGKLRRIMPDSSLSASILMSPFLESVPYGEKYTIDIVRALESEDFMTPIGLRSLARKHAACFDYATYHGAWTVWEINNFFYLLGLERHGLFALASRQAQRSILSMSHGFREFNYISPDTDTVFFKLATEVKPGHEELIATSRPEMPQAWSIMSAMYAQRRLPFLRSREEEKGSWQDELTQEILRKPQPTLREGKAWLNLKEGQRREQALEWRL